MQYEFNLHNNPENNTEDLVLKQIKELPDDELLAEAKRLRALENSLRLTNDGKEADEIQNLLSLHENECTERRLSTH